MRTILRRLALWVLGISSSQLETLRGQPTVLTGAMVAANSITGDKLSASSVGSTAIAPRSIGLEHLTEEVRERLLVHPVPNNGGQRSAPTLGSGRLAPRPAPTTTNVGESRRPEPFVPDLAARDGGSGGQ